MVMTFNSVFPPLRKSPAPALAIGFDHADCMSHGYFPALFFCSAGGVVIRQST
jgi:hypothetical protein